MRATLRPRLILPLLAVLMLGACSSLVPRLTAPQLSVVNVEVLKGDMMQQQLRVRLHVQNPNDRELRVRGITYEIEVAGEKFAHGESERDFVVPALGDAEFDVNVTANAAGALLRFALSGNRKNIDYRIFGKVSLAQGLLRSIPFEQKGLFPLR